MNNNEITILKHLDLIDDEDPMGESLIHSDKSSKVWIPDTQGTVLGSSQKPELELNISNILADNIPVYKRRGGGGCVLLSSKGLCYAIKFKRTKNLSIHDYFEMGTSVLQNVLWKEYQIESHMRGISDLAVGEKKILGCSLYLPKDFALFYASVLVEDESEAISKYLSHPTREPNYRQGRNHSEFISSISHFVDHDDSKNDTSLVQKIKKLLEIEIETEWTHALA